MFNVFSGFILLLTCIVVQVRAIYYFRLETFPAPKHKLTAMLFPMLPVYYHQLRPDQRGRRLCHQLASATMLTISLALNLSVRSAVTPPTTPTLLSLTMASTMTALPSSLFKMIHGIAQCFTIQAFNFGCQYFEFANRFCLCHQIAAEYTC